jgi:hypothetical protein
MRRRLVPFAGVCLLLGSIHPASASSIRIVGPSVRIGEKLVFSPDTRVEVMPDGSVPSMAGPWTPGDHEVATVFWRAGRSA